MVVFSFIFNFLKLNLVKKMFGQWLKLTIGVDHELLCCKLLILFAKIYCLFVFLKFSEENLQVRGTYINYVMQKWGFITIHEFSFKVLKFCIENGEGSHWKYWKNALRNTWMFPKLSMFLLHDRLIIGRWESIFTYIFHENLAFWEF